MAAIRIAMWSGPRNISTALMRSFESRGDCWVTDEPLYAHYLASTGLDHPMAAEIVARSDTDWRSVTEWLRGPIPAARPIWYQKHMAHHLLPEIGREWLAGLTHAFLIRDPAEMIPSLTAKLGPPRIEDTGLPQQVEIFRRIRAESSVVPPVVDARDILEDPSPMLAALCDAIGIPFTARMLTWAPGRRETDGIWAEHWYDAVEKSTGFAPYRPTDATIPPELERVHAACDELYRELRSHRLGFGP